MVNLKLNKFYGLNFMISWFILKTMAKIEGSRGVPDEQRLMTRLFRNYDNSVRPVFNSSHSINVTFGLTLIQIMNMDEKNQVLVTNVWLEHVWRDESLHWDPEDYNGLEVVRLPASKLWLPDIVLYNNADDFTTGYMPSNAMVDSTGVVFWSPPVRLLSSCKVDITFFPFDEQVCGLKFGSWTYDQAQVDMMTKQATVDMSNYVSNGEWALRKTLIMRNEVVYPIGPNVYPDVTVYFYMHRRILYYILNIILPCVWLNMLSLLAFCLPPDAGEKITLGITVLLSYSVFMLLVAENMPQTSEYVPLVGIYLTMSMAMTSISVILTVCVLKLHHCGPGQSRVPRWLRHLVLGVLARLMRCNCAPSRDKHTRKRASESPGHRLASAEGSDICLRLMGEVDDKYSPIADLKNRISAERFQNHVDRDPSRDTPPVTASNYTSNHESCSYRPKARITPVSASAYNNTHKLRFSDMPSTPLLNNSASSNPHRAAHGDTHAQELERLLDDILHNVKILVMKKDRQEAEVALVDEWRMLAQVMDRFLFWLFLFITLAATLVLMVVVPLLEYMRAAEED